MRNLKILSQAFVLMVFISTTSMAQNAPPPSNNPIINFAYKYTTPKAMYGLSDTAPVASAEDAERLLGDGIYAAKYNQGVGICVYTAGFAGVIQLMQYAMGAAQGHHKSIAASFFTGLLWGGAYMSGFMEMVSDTMNAPLRWVTGLIVSLPSDELRALEIQFLLKKHTIPERVREDIGRRFFALRTGVEPYSAVAKDYLTAVLSFPTDVTEPVFDKSKLDGKFAVHSQYVRDALETIAFGLAKTQSGKSVFFLMGNPGTGKTYAAEAIADSLGLPSCNINLVLGQNSGELVGTEKSLGKLAQCMIDKGTLNPLMIFNDVDRVIIGDKGIAASFLGIFDRQQKTIYNPFLRMDINISQLTFVMTGNSDFEGKDLEALNGRIAERVSFVLPSQESLKTVLIPISKDFNQ